MFNSIHLQLIFVSYILISVICYKINSNNSISINNKLENQSQVDQVKEIVNKKWHTAQANVKINLHLQILGLSSGRKNSTFVNLLNVMQMLDYGDTISLSRLTKGASKKLSKLFQPTSSGDYLLYIDDTKVEGIEGKRMPCLFPIGDDNLISKGLNLIRMKSKENLDVNFIAIVNKKIPSGTGLGGGSADAATSIKLVSKIIQSDINTTEIAKEIGTDVPFLLGSEHEFNSAISVGKGDTFEYIQLKDLPSNVYIFIPNGFVETCKVYDRIKKLYPFGSKLSELQLNNAKELALKNISKLEFRNDLLPTSCHFSKQLVKLTNILESQNIFNWSLSGSGSACFGFVNNNVTERQITKELNRISLEFEDTLAIIQTNRI